MNLSVPDFFSHFHVSYLLKKAFDIRFEGLNFKVKAAIVCLHFTFRDILQEK